MQLSRYSDQSRGTTTNNYGFYSITIPAVDSTGISFSYLGYQPQIKKIYLHANLDIQIEMTPVANALDGGSGHC